MSSATSTYGANIAFIEELYEKYRSDPNSVSASWREFFRDFQEPEQDVGQALSSSGPAESRPHESTAPPRPVPVAPQTLGATPLRGAAGKIAQNMEASL